jgi:3',5'-nucleoside bisphosphate phosphatase
LIARAEEVFTRSLLADLHIHTVLSPCAEVEMIPPLIVRRAQEQGLGLIAITDHNSAENCSAVRQAAVGSELIVLPGMETQTAEDVHVVCLFDTVEQARAWQDIVYEHLPARLNPTDILGAQFVVEAAGAYLRTEERLLLTGVDLSLDEVVRRVAGLGGAAIPAHIDRPSFSLLANLGFVPPYLDVPALEIFRRTDPHELLGAHPELARWPLIRSSDAHQLQDLRPSLRLRLPEVSVTAVVAVLRDRTGNNFSLV